MRTLWAEQALTSLGWASSVRIEIGDDGRISAVVPDAAPAGERYGILLPAPANLHSHAFQRAIAGLTERRGPDPQDSFWTWRTLMYRFLERLTPDDIETIAAFAQMEMLEAGYAAVAEFHYLHHGPGGSAYDDPAEMSARIAAAAEYTGIGLTLLPVFYQRGGCDDRALAGGQFRFGNDQDGFARLWQSAAGAVAGLSADTRIGVAAHSLRAVDVDGLAFAAALAPEAPMHIHIAEQTAEVDEVVAAYGARPVEWLLGNHDVDARWCLVHATQMVPEETAALAASGAIAGLCPITEANLGDGIFDGRRYLDAGGRFGIGTDSNVRIALAEELCMLEYSQRLAGRARAVLAEADASTGRVLYENAVAGGTLAAGRESGAIAPGRLADLVALDAAAIDLDGKSGDTILDAWVFTGDDRLVTDVWSAGRHMVRGGHHQKHDAISARYSATIAALGAMS